MHHSSAQLPSLVRTRVRTLLAVCAGLCPLACAHAELTTTALARFSSNYLYHGYTKSDDHPATQAHVGVSHDSGLYGGVWMSQVDFGGAQLELIPYFGWQTTVASDFRFDTVLSGYVYESELFGQNGDYLETSASLDWRGLLSARVSFAADTYGSGHDTAAVEVKGRYPVTDVLDISGGVGYDTMAHVTTYDVLYWNAGLSYFLGAHVVLDLRYVDNGYTREVHGDATAQRWAQAEVGSRAVLSISVGF